MRLHELLDRCGCFACESSENPEIGGVSTDSRKVKAGDLFIAIPGYRDDGSRYIGDALDRGAGAVIVDEGVFVQVRREFDAPVCKSSSPRRCALLLSRVLYGNPAESLCMIGVTGTNGKTTVTYLIEAIAREAGYSPGVIGTVTYRWSGREIRAHNTTPDPIEIQELLCRMRDDGTSHVIMEVSSHALAMDRVFPPDFDYAVFTNLSQDHLDFHTSMDDYFHAKATLFEGLNEDRQVIINIDDVYGKKLMARTRASVTTYGMGDGADFRGHNPELSIEGTSFLINGERFKTSLVGLHNLYNILASVALTSRTGVSDEVISKALSRVRRIPGRFEAAVEGRDFHVFIDYAHTPDALAHLLEAANSLKRGRIITVFGCGGDRDRGKRPKMGRVVEENTDIAIVTSDNPRTEDPLAIIEDIKAGLSRDDHTIIPDRREAIHRAIELARKDDIVLIAGKGHEDYQILGEKTIHFDDREVVAQAVQDLGR